MADEPVVPAAAAPAPAPVVETPAPAPASVIETPAPAAVEPAAPAEAAKPAEAPVPEAPKEELHTDKPTLLETAGKVEEPKPGEKKPEDVKPGEETKAPEAPKATFEPYTLPEGATVDQTKLDEFNQLLVKDDLTPQQRGQALVDLHIKELTNYDTALRQQQHRDYAKTREDWTKKLMADPELGGSGYNTTLTAGAKMRDLFVSRHKPGSDAYARDMGEFNDMLRITGAGDHPAFWRMLNNIARRFEEPAAPHVAYKPPPDIGKPPGRNGSRRNALYGG